VLLVAAGRAQPKAVASPQCAMLTLAVAVAAVLGCSEGDNLAAAATAASSASATPAPPVGSARPAAPSSVLDGAVLEVVHTDHYSYLHLETATGRFWAAVPLAEVTAGSRVVVERAMHIRRFHSPTLERDFDSVHFGVLQGAPPQKQPPPPPPPLPIPADIVVAKAAGPAGVTVAEVVGSGRQMQGKTVQLRAIVVQVRANILDTHWVHVQDGSGSQDAGSHDLVVTSPDRPQVGQLVLVTGTVATDLRLGEDLTFPILVQKATIVPGG
jgi:hypothetical protein